MCSARAWCRVPPPVEPGGGGAQSGRVRCGPPHFIAAAAPPLRPLLGHRPLRLHLHPGPSQVRIYMTYESRGGPKGVRRRSEGGIFTKGRENIPVAGTTRRRVERIYP
eukprot:1177126-Prorocentrum_minimum.AAC.1